MTEFLIFLEKLADERAQATEPAFHLQGGIDTPTIVRRVRNFAAVHVLSVVAQSPDSEVLERLQS
jgi:hypothetical protein